MWPDHGQQVRGVCDRSGHDVNDVGMLKDRNHLHGLFHMLHDAVQVRFKKLLTKTYSRNSLFKYNRNLYRMSQQTLLKGAELGTWRDSISDPRVLQHHLLLFFIRAKEQAVSLLTQVV